MGRYVIEAPLGVGAMGVVYRAFDSKLRRNVALKVLHREHRPSATAGVPALREAWALAKLRHPNVVTVYDVETLSGRVVLAMELVEGRTLANFFEQRPSPRDVHEVMARVGAGLAAAHAEGLIHRDFKPSNVLLDPKGWPKVADFGIAKLGRVDPHPTDDDARPDELELVPSMSPSRGPSMVPSMVPSMGPSTAAGTPAYMAPEQHAGQDVDVTVDVYAFCLTYWEGLTGRRPFAGATSTSDLARAKTRPPTPPRGVGRTDAAVFELLRRGLAFDPSERWPGLDLLLAELRRVVSRSSRRDVHVLAGASVLLVAGAVVASSTHAEATACDASHRLSSRWTEERRDAIRTAFGAQRGGFAEEAWTATRERLDAYFLGWSEAYDAACTGSPGETHRLQHAARLACLEAAVLEADAVLRHLETVERDDVHRALDVVSDLPDPESCTEVESLASYRAATEAPEGVMAALAEARVLRRAGRYEDALQILDGVQSQVESSPLFHARLSLERARCLSRLGRPEEAYERASSSLDVFFEHESWEFASEASLVMVHLESTELGRVHEAEATSEFALRIARRSKDRELIADAWWRRGLVHVVSGRAQEGVVALEDAIAAKLEPPVSSWRDAASIHGDLATAYLRLADDDAALVHARRALELFEGQAYPTHPDVVEAHSRVGVILHERGEFEEALVRYETALELARRGGHGPSTRARLLSNSAITWTALGDHERALAAFGQVVTIMTEHQGPDHVHTATALNNYGIALGDARRFEQSEAMHRRALEIRTQALGPEHPLVAQSLENLGKVVHASEGARAARPFFERAIELRERIQGPAHPETGQSRGHLAEVLLELEECHAAGALLDSALFDLEAARGPDDAVVQELRELDARARETCGG